MSKPDWKDAPDWAQWLAQDYDGRWYWFRDEPELNGGVWDSTGRLRIARKDKPPMLPCEPRPETES